MMQETDDPFRGQKPIELLPLFINNTGNWSIFQAPGVPKYQFLLWSATRLGNHLQLAICAPNRLTYKQLP